MRQQTAVGLSHGCGRWTCGGGQELEANDGRCRGGAWDQTALSRLQQAVGPSEMYEVQAAVTDALECAVQWPSHHNSAILITICPPARVIAPLFSPVPRPSIPKILKPSSTSQIGDTATASCCPPDHGHKESFGAWLTPTTTPAIATAQAMNLHTRALATQTHTRGARSLGSQP